MNQSTIWVRIDQQIGLGANRLKLGYESTAFGRETTVGTNRLCTSGLRWLLVPDLAPRVLLWVLRFSSLLKNQQPENNGQEELPNGMFTA